MSATNLYENLKNESPLSSGNESIDDVLGGGFFPFLTHFIWCPKAVYSNLLMDIAIQYLLPAVEGGKGGNRRKIHYFDVAMPYPGLSSLHRFNPFYLAKQASHFEMGLGYILERIIISRISSRTHYYLELEKSINRSNEISGIFLNGVSPYFRKEDKGQIIHLLNQFAGNREEKQYLIATAGNSRCNLEYDRMRGKCISRFFDVFLLIKKFPHFIELSLKKHPLFPETKQRIWKDVKMFDTSHKVPKKKTIQKKLSDITFHKQNISKNLGGTKRGKRH